MDDLYIRIEWPFVQEFMEFAWFNSVAILDNREDVKPQTYLIPVSYYNQEAEKLGYLSINIEE